jgi:hypothetical protein
MMILLPRARGAIICFAYKRARQLLLHVLLAGHQEQCSHMLHWFQHHDLLLHPRHLEEEICHLSPWKGDVLLGNCRWLYCLQDNSSSAAVFVVLLLPWHCHQLRPLPPDVIL